jgi:hypothetical protein
LKRWDILNQLGARTAEVKERLKKPAALNKLLDWQFIASSHG